MRCCCLLVLLVLLCLELDVESKRSVDSLNATINALSSEQQAIEQHRLEMQNKMNNMTGR